jgi:hypothetical protein
MPIAVDFDAAYTLPADLQVVQRDETTIQIGTERPRRMMLVDAPVGATDVLARLNGAMSAGEAVSRSDGDPLIWRSLLGAMLGAGLLVRAPHAHANPTHLQGEQLSLIHRHGPTVAERVLRARSDAVVVVDGSGPVAVTVAGLLAGAGVGHVHQRALDPRTLPVASGGPDASDHAHPPVDALPDQAAAWQAAPDVRVHRPAPQVPPSMVVLAEQTLPDLARAAELVTSLIPHLAVRVTQARAIVGPLVLPGRSACLNCVEKHRADADPGWPAVAAVMRTRALHPAVLSAHAAAEIAAEQVLDLLDGVHPPESVNATVERRAGSLTVHRRRWTPHPDCGCRLLSGQL